MTRKTHFFKLGLFVILAVGLGALFLIVFGAGRFFKKEFMVETCFNESVQGLSIGSEVKYKGIQIGSVQSITSASQVYNARSDYVLVRLSLQEDVSLGQTGNSAEERVKKAIENGLVIRLSFKGITGVAYLETDYSESLSDVPLTIAWTPKFTYIPSQRSNMKQFGDSLSQILDSLTAINVRGITQDIERLLKTLDTKMTELDTVNISTLTASLLQELKDTNLKINQAIKPDRINRLMDDAGASFAELRTIVENTRSPLDTAARDFQKAAGSARVLAENLETRFGPDIDGLSTGLNELLKNLAAISELVNHMVWLNSDKIKLIVDNLETASENLKQMSKDIKQYPGRLIFEKPPEKTDLEKQQ